MFQVSTAGSTFFEGMNHQEQIEIECIIKRYQGADFSIGFP